MQDLGVHDSLWLKPHPTKIGETIMPPAPWVMHKEEGLFFLETMAKLKLPPWHALGFKKHIVKGKLEVMKSHDYHVLTQ
jgi:hypothetical protein